MKLLSERQVCDLLGVSRATIGRWRKLADFPKPKKLGSHRSSPIKYVDDEVYEWIGSRPRA